MTPDPPPSGEACDTCEFYRMEDTRWILESHIHGLHQELAQLRAERDGYKLAAETQVEAVVLAVKERDKLKALVRQVRDRHRGVFLQTSDEEETWCRAANAALREAK
jgi:hypothetical protein